MKWRRLYDLFMREDGWAAAGAILGGLVSAGVSAYGASKAGQGGQITPSNNQIQGSIANRPMGEDTILSYLNAEQLYELGVPTGVIQDQLLIQSVTNNKGPRQGRALSTALDRARKAAQSGDVKAATHWASLANMQAGAAGGTVNFQNGQINVSLSGSDAQTIAQLQAQDAAHGDALTQRLQALDKLNRGVAGLTVPTSQDIADQEATQKDYLNRQLDQTLQTQRDQITEAANAGGYSPSGQLSTLDKQELQQRMDINDTQGLQRALQLIGGTTGVQAGSLAALKAALQPTFGNAVQGAADLSSQNTLTSLSLGTQLGIANAQAEAARNVSQANAYSQLGSTGLQASILGYALTRPASTGPANSGIPPSLFGQTSY